MAKIVFSDFDKFAESIIGIAGQFVPMAPSISEWWVKSAELGQIKIQQLQIGGAATFAGDGTPNTITLGVPMTAPNSVRIDGQALELDSFLLSCENRPFTWTQGDVTCWAGVTLPTKILRMPHKLQSALDATTTPCWRARVADITQLQSLVTRVIAAYADGNVGIEPPAEPEVVSAVTAILEHSMSAPHLRRIGRPQISRERIIARTLTLMETNEGQPLFIEDLCRATQVSERTLRAIFHEYFGVGPIRLLKVRQLRNVRADLLQADPRRDTVTRVAARHGIWDFAQFARNYKTLFGESPSRTLRTPPSELRQHSTLSWLHYALRVFGESTPAPARPFSASAVTSTNAFR